MESDFRFKLDSKYPFVFEKLSRTNGIVRGMIRAYINVELISKKWVTLEVYRLFKIGEGNVDWTDAKHFIQYEFHREFLEDWLDNAFKNKVVTVDLMDSQKLYRKGREVMTGFDCSIEIKIKQTLFLTGRWRKMRKYLPYLNIVSVEVK